MQKKYDVFISYASQDLEIAEKLLETLERSGFKCWMAPDSIPEGSNYAECIPQGINGSEAFLIVLSRNAMRSVWVPKELDQALNHRKLILPFKIDSSELSHSFTFYLTNVQCIDAHDQFDLKLNQIISRLQNCHEIQTIHEPQLKQILRYPIPQMIGRDTEMQVIHQAFQSTNLVCLYGQGGIGKSELAKKYAVWAAKQGGMTRISYNDIHDSISHTIEELKFNDLNEKAIGIGEVLYQAKLQLLHNTNEDTLLILDGIDPLDPALSSLRTLPCRVLLISRRKIQDCHCIHLSGFSSEQEYLQLFNQNYEDGDPDDPDQRQTVLDIVHKTQGNLLIIKLIANLLQSSGLAPDELSEAVFEEETFVFHDIEDSLYNHICRLYEIASLSDDEAQIMSDLVLFPESGVKKHMFRRLTGHRMNIVHHLIHRGWIIEDAGCLRIPAILIPILYKKLTPGTTHNSRLLQNILQELDISGLYLLNQTRELGNIARHLTTLLHDTDLLTCRLLYSVGMYFNAATYQSLLQIKDNANSISMFNQYVNRESRKQNEYLEALRFVRQAERIYRIGNFDSPLDLAEIFNAYGCIYFNLQQYSDSRAAHQKAYTIRLEQLGPVDLQTITSARRKATALLLIGDAAGALQEYRQNLDVIQQHPDCVSDLEISRAYSYIGNTLLLLHQEDEAVAIYQQVCRYLLFCDGEWIGKIENYLIFADLLKKHNHPEEAMDWIRKAQDTCLDLFGDLNNEYGLRILSALQ